MAVARKRTRMKRTQVCLTIEDYDVVRGMAERRHQSLSQVVRGAIRREAEAERFLIDPLRDLIGCAECDDPHASETIDDVVYGDDIH